MNSDQMAFGISALGSCEDSRFPRGGCSVSQHGSLQTCSGEVGGQRWMLCGHTSGQEENHRFQVLTKYAAGYRGLTISALSLKDAKLSLSHPLKYDVILCPFIFL